MPRVLGLAVVLLVFLAIPASLYAEDAAEHLRLAITDAKPRVAHPGG